jgi:hypothetical protein
MTMAKEEICNSCKKKIMSSSSSVKFRCPNCDKDDIIRCKECRSGVIKYICSKCGFEGPN